MSHKTRPTANTPTLAVIGSGSRGPKLARHFAALGALKLICDRTAPPLPLPRERYPDVEICFDLPEVMAREDITGVAIATPADMQSTIAAQALCAGKHVFAQAPLALNNTQARELIQLAHKKKLTLMVGHRHHDHPGAKQLIKLIRSGDLGRIEYIHAEHLDSSRRVARQNVVQSHGVQDLSLILALAGEPPGNVFATGACDRRNPIADIATVHMTFSGGVQGHLFVSRRHPFKKCKVTVVGRSQTAVLDDLQPWRDKLLIYPHLAEDNTCRAKTVAGQPYRLTGHHEAPAAHACRRFLQCMTTGKQPVNAGAEDFQVVKILNIVEKNLNAGTGRESVQPIGSTTSSTEINILKKEAPSVHPTAVLAQDCQIGTDTKIQPFAHILSGSQIGRNCKIAQNVQVGPDVRVGENCTIQDNVAVYRGVTLEDNVFCGPSMVFTSIYNPRAEICKLSEVRPTLVRHGATLGANCTIVCGNTIGRYALVGAGSVVNRDIADHAIVVGNPAKQIGWACHCGEKLTGELRCPVCNGKYKRCENGLAKAAAPAPDHKHKVPN